MKLCDWCGDGVPENERSFVNLRPENWPFSECRSKHVQIQLHDECCAALVGILREGGSRPRPAATTPQKQSGLRGVFR